MYSSFFFQTFGLKETTPSNAAFITGMNVMLVPIILVFKGKKLQLNPTIYANILATIGIALLTINFSNFSVNFGDIIILGTAISIAIHIILTGDYVEKESAIMLTISQFMSLAVLGLLGALIFEPTLFSSINTFSNAIWIALFITVLFATIFAFFTQTFAQKNAISPITIAIIFAFEPIFALMYSLYIGEEFLDAIKLIGMILILVATFMVIIKKDPLEDDSRFS